MQLEYRLQTVSGKPGLIADSGFNNILSYRTFNETVNFGLAMVQASNQRTARLPNLNQVLLSFDADFETDNEIDLKVNGKSIDTVVFDTDHDTTIQNLADEIEAQDPVASATVQGTNNREILIEAEPDQEVFITDIQITGGTSQPNASLDERTTDTFIGVNTFKHGMEQDLQGNVYWEMNDSMCVMSRGRVYVQPEDSATVGSDVYVRFIEDTNNDKFKGQIRTDDDGGTAFKISNVRWIRGKDDDNLAVLEVNLP